MMGDSEELAAHGVREVSMMGDSFMCHLYVAFVTLLRDDWEAGALLASAGTAKACRSQMDFNNTVCGGAVHVMLIYHFWMTPNETLRDEDVVLWSFGKIPKP